MAAKMQLELRDGRPEDVPQMVEIYFDAFADDQVGQRFCPRNSKLARDWITNSLSTEILSKNNRFLAVWDVSPEAAAAAAAPPGDEEKKDEGEIMVGFAKWTIPGAPPDPLPKLDEWPQDGDPAFAASFFGQLHEGHVRTLGGRPHWFLEMLAVRKRCWGRGVASPMLRYGVERADEAGVECFLDASPAGRPVYERFGFRVVHTLTFMDGTYLQCAMLRDARKKN